MQIYIAKPGGQKEGPFTVDQINRDLAAKRYRESDYWAWHEGLPQWMPLHAIPGILPVHSAPDPRRVTTPEPRKPAVPQGRPPTGAESIPDVFMRATPAEKKPERSIQPSTDHYRKASPAAERKPVPSSDVIPDVFTKATPPAEKKSERVGQSNTDVFRKASPAPERKPESNANPIPDIFTKATPPAEKKSERAAQSNTDIFKRAIIGGDRTSERMANPGTDVFSKVNSAPAPVPAQVAPQPARSPAVSKSEDSSGLPFNALEQIFIFTSGEGRNIFQSAAVAQKLQEITGEVLTSIRGKIPVSVVGRVGIGVEIMIDGEIPEKAWRAMFAIKPAIAQKAKDDLMQICVRTFSVETQDSVALFLLYSKEKMQLATA